MDQKELQEVFNEINKILTEKKATLSDVRIISVQLQDMVENYKLQGAIRDLQEFLIDTKVISKEQIEEYIKNKNITLGPNDKS